MLYDKRWDSKKNAQKDDAEVFSLHGLIAWLETKNPDERYNYYCVDGSCLIDLYLGTNCRDNYWFDNHLKVCGGEDNYSAIAAAKPWRFGAALQRARKIAESA